jgi:PPM family protein phosphatase
MTPMEDTTAEFAVHELATATELKVRPRVTIACKTDVGRIREINQDKFEYFLPEEEGKLATRGLVFLVCDGMGGHAAGQVASELAAKTFIDVYLNHPASDPQVAMQAAAQAANRFVMDNARAFPQRRGMGTTLSGLILIQDRAFTVQVGDSRIYRMRDGILQQLTDDHTLVDEMLRAGMLTEEEAAVHPQKHVLTRAIGVEADLRTDVAEHELLVGDVFMLCSDGVINHVPDEEVAEILRSMPPSHAAWRLIGQSLVGGGSDNTTTIVIRVDALENL